MDTTISEPLIDESLDMHRETVRETLDSIAQDVGAALRDNGMNYAVFFTAGQSDRTVITIATPFDPSDEIWERMISTAIEIISDRLGGIKLGSRELPCASANLVMTAADLTADF
jgi:hypothetical protein